MNTMLTPHRCLLGLCAVLLLAACQPDNQRPGLWLSGEPVPYPDDWTFADQYKEIALEVGTPYLLRHSVTIWCATLNGDLYVAASRPEEKHWPGWVNEDPDVRIRIGDELFEARLEPLDDPDLIRQVVAVQAEKYGFDLPEGPTGA
jgi:hypothetical protein